MAILFALRLLPDLGYHHAFFFFFFFLKAGGITLVHDTDW